MEKQTKQNADDAKIELEDQFLLRLPEEEAKYIHNILKVKPKKIKKVLQIELHEDLRNGNVYVKKKKLPATLVNLPTVIESCKTINKVNIYKTGVISQMLLCDGPKKIRNKTKDATEGDDKKYLHPHGITPPMKNVTKQRFRKTMRNHEDVKEAADVQKEVTLLLRTDYEAVASRYEIIPCGNNNAGEEITEHMLFGAISSSGSDDGSSSTSLYDIMEFNN